MSIYDKLPKKNDKKDIKKKSVIRKTFSIDYKLYEKLKFLSDNVYDVSINQLVNMAIEELIRTENVKVYKKDYKEIKFDRTYTIKEETLNELQKLKEKYNISIKKLIDIAVYNAIYDESTKN